MRWTQPEMEGGTTKRDVEKVRGARDEGSRVELCPGRKAGSGQNHDCVSRCHVVDQPTCDFILNMAWFVNNRHPC